MEKNSKKDSKERFFEIMGRVDKTFKPKLNEDFGSEIPAEDDLAAQISGGEPVQEKSPEEKLQELSAKVDELYAIIHGSEVENDEENLQEWNFDKKKGEKDDDKEDKPKGKTQFNFDKKEDKESEEHEDNESHEEKEESEHEDKKELDEAKPKLPVAAIAKVGK